MSAARGWVAVQHVPFEGPGAIATEARRRGVPLGACRPYAGDPLPAVADIGGLVVMGGPMGVSDTAEHPHLAAELELIAASVAAGLPVLGVCLGAQLLAAALGARVYRGAQLEIGAGRVGLTAEGQADPMLGAALAAMDADAAGVDAEELAVIHWHQDTFELPSGAVRLAGSALYPNQAFRVGRCVYGLQFHLEVDRELARDWRAHLPSGVEIDEPACCAVERVGRAALAAFFDLAHAPGVEDR
jgi:GMP synthase (glutamine-hydrolysing)